MSILLTFVFSHRNVFDPEEKLSIPIKMMKTNKKMFDPDGAKYSIVEPGSTSDLLVLIIKWDNIKSLFSSQGKRNKENSNRNRTFKIC